MATTRDPVSDAARHEQVIETLAQETRMPLAHVRELYAIEHARLDAQARVKTYVTVIATRLVRHVLHAERTLPEA